MAVLACALTLVILLLQQAQAQILPPDNGYSSKLLKFLGLETKRANDADAVNPVKSNKRDKDALRVEVNTGIDPSNIPTPTVVITSNTTGYLPLLEGLNSPCRYFKRGDNQSYQYASSDFPYKKDEICITSIIAERPQKMLLDVAFFNVHSSDSFTLFTVKGSYRQFTNGDHEASFLVPTSAVKLNFTSDAAAVSTGFVFEFKSETSVCHQTISLPPGASGNLSLPADPYPAHTVCEWWITATDNTDKIELTIERMSIGASNVCSADYLLVDKLGDTFYEDSEVLCGSTTPEPIVSTEHKMNILFYGFVGGKPGFTATYKTA